MTVLEAFWVNPSGQFVSFHDGRLVGDPEDPVVTGVVVTPSGVWGAGFQNAGDKLDASVHGDAAGVLVTGADVAGCHLSSDYGGKWRPNNTGFTNNNDTRCAGILASPSIPNRVYWYSSTQNGTGTNNAIWQGTYDVEIGGIVRWSKVASLPVGAAAGNGATPGSPSNDGHPRQTGRRMLAVDEVGGFIFAGTVNGVYRAPLSGTGTPATQIVLGGATPTSAGARAITSLSFDPQDRTVLYATSDVTGGVAGGGVHRITNPASAPVVQATYAPAAWAGADGLVYPQSCVALVRGGATRLVVTTGRQSRSTLTGNCIVFWDGASGTFTNSANWQDLTGNINDDESGTFVSSGVTRLTYNRWSGLAAVVLTGGTTIRMIATHSMDMSGATGSKVAWTDWASGTPTWSKASSSNVDVRIADTNGAEWWLADPLPSLMLHAGGYDSVNPIIDPNNHARWYVMGRSGIWRTQNAGATWHPIVEGTAVTTSWAVSSTGGLTCVGDVDWTFLRSDGADGMRSQPVQNRPTGTVAWNLARIGNKMAIFTGNRDRAEDGSTYVHPDPWASGSGAWVNEVMTATTSTGVPAAVKRSVTATAASNAFTTSAAHSLRNGADVKFYGGSLPGGITSGTTYFVNSMPSATTFTVSASSGGATVDLSSDGSATAVSQYWGKHFKGGALGTDGAGVQVLLTAHADWPTSSEGKGGVGALYRKVGSGSSGVWSEPTLTNSDASAFAGDIGVLQQKQTRVHFAWPNDGTVVWMLDPGTGVWQSQDRGATFRRRQTFAQAYAYFSGHLVASPSQTGVYYYCRVDGFWKVTSGHTASPVLTEVGAGTIAAPAAACVNPLNGRVMVAENATSPNGTRLWLSEDSGASWEDITNPGWESMGGTIKHMAWDATDSAGTGGVVHFAMYAGYGRVENIL